MNRLESRIERVQKKMEKDGAKKQDRSDLVAKSLRDLSRVYGDGREIPIMAWEEYERKYQELLIKYSGRKSIVMKCYKIQVSL